MEIALAVTPGETLTFNVGQGGAGGAASQPGGQGGATNLTQGGNWAIIVGGGDGGGQGVPGECYPANFGTAAPVDQTFLPSAVLLSGTDGVNGTNGNCIFGGDGGSFAPNTGAAGSGGAGGAVDTAGLPGKNGWLLIEVVG